VVSTFGKKDERALLASEKEVGKKREAKRSVYPSRKKKKSCGLLAAEWKDPGSGGGEEKPSTGKVDLAAKRKKARKERLQHPILGV